EEGRVVKWHKREGDAVKTGDTLAEVETDKAVMDLVARADGVLRQVSATEGQTIPVGNVVAVIAAPGETVGAAPAAAPRPAAPPSPRSQEILSEGPAYDDVPLTQIRKTIAKRLVTSIGPIPHFFLTTEVDMERAAEARDALNKQLGDQGKVSFNDVIIKATALALVKHRACNAWFQDDHIRYWNEVHLGMAVAVEDGLITPVLRHADL